MATLSVSVPEDLREQMSKLEEINWSAVARKAFEEKIEEIEFLKKIAQKSKLTQKDADKIATRIKKSMARQFKEM